MPLVDVDTAKVHLRVSHDSEDPLITSYLASAEEQAASFLGRNVYASAEDLTAAIAAAPAALTAASAAYDAAMEAAANLDNSVERTLNEQAAMAAYTAAIEDWRRTSYGMVVKESVRTAILLITASLWEHRGDEEAIDGIPKAAQAFLWPARIGLGV